MADNSTELHYAVYIFEDMLTSLELKKYNDFCLKRRSGNPNSDERICYILGIIDGRNNT
jgi:hypothetical protein